MKKVLAVILALVIGFLIVKFAIFLFKFAIAMTFNFVLILLVLAVAGPIYLVFRKLLTK